MNLQHKSISYLTSLYRANHTDKQICAEIDAEVDRRIENETILKGYKWVNDPNDDFRGDKAHQEKCLAYTGNAGKHLSLRPRGWKYSNNPVVCLGLVPL